MLLKKIASKIFGSFFSYFSFASLLVVNDSRMPAEYSDLGKPKVKPAWRKQRIYAELI